MEFQWSSIYEGVEFHGVPKSFAFMHEEEFDSVSHVCFHYSCKELNLEFLEFQFGTKLLYENLEIKKFFENFEKIFRRSKGLR